MVRIDKIKIIINEDWKFEILFFVLMSGMRRGFMIFLFEGVEFFIWLDFYLHLSG